MWKDQFIKQIQSREIPTSKKNKSILFYPLLFMHFFFKKNKGDYTPTIFDNTVKDIIVDTKPVVAELWDTAGTRLKATL